MISLLGQWLGKLDGEAGYKITINLDKSPITDSYEGTMYDEYTGSKPVILKVLSLNDNDQFVVEGNTIPSDVLWGEKEEAIKISGAISVDNILSVQWTGRGSSYYATLTLNYGGDADVAPVENITWVEFKQKISQLSPKEYIFRGQCDARWKLRTSFYRAGRFDLKKYFQCDVPDLRRNINSISNHIFSATDNDALLNLAQHHGYPTPLIDWTRSPYIAAYFAFQSIDRSVVNGGSKIYLFNRKKWDEIKRKNKFIMDSFPNESMIVARDMIDFFDLPILNNPRALPQQALVALSNIDDIESYFQVNHGEDKILSAFSLSHKEKENIVQDLNYMGISAASLFPGIDGLCSKLKQDNF